MSVLCICFNISLIALTCNFCLLSFVPQIVHMDKYTVVYYMANTCLLLSVVFVHAWYIELTRGTNGK